MNLLGDAIAWLFDPARLSGPNSIGLRVWQHVWVTGAAVLLASVLALPIGILVGHTRRGRGGVVTFAGAARAIPTLGLLTLAGLAFGIGLTAPMVALVVLAIPSLLAGAYAGVESVDKATVDASRAIGFTEWQVVGRVELPLAAPVILGGLRAAILQVVATATLAAYISDTGLGRYIFAGLKTHDYPQMLGGALLVAALALVLEIIMAALQGRARRLAGHG